MSTSNASILALPSELKVQIFVHLPAKEIVRLRAVCQDFLDTVDTHAARISKEIRARELSRLQDFVNYHVTYEGDVTFLEALSRWISLRGCAPSKQHWSSLANSASMEAFSKHWTPLKRYPDLSNETQEIICGIARYIWRMSEYLPTADIRDSMLLYQFLREMQRLKRSDSGFYHVDFVSIYKELRYTPGGRLSGPPRKIQRIVDEEIAFVNESFAPLVKPSELVRTINPLSYVRWIKPQLAVEIFGVPRLPWTSQFEYCYESDWAYHTISRIIKLHFGNLPIHPLLLAAGMEELRIY